MHLRGAEQMGPPDRLIHDICVPEIGQSGDLALIID